MLKRILVSILIVVLMNTWGYLRAPQLNEDDIYLVSGTCIEVDFGIRYEQPKLIMENGKAYSYSYFEGYSPKADKLTNKYISFYASDKFLFSNQIVAWNENSVIKEKTLDDFNKNSVRGYIFMALASLIIGGMLLLRPILEMWKKHDEKREEFENIKRKNAKKQKKKQQCQKYENINDFTQYSHKQNKNVSKKKQKLRKKQNAYSIKNQPSKNEGDNTK